MPHAVRRRGGLALAVFVLALVVLVAPGCDHEHGHYHGYVVLPGTLEVYNVAGSRAAVEGVETQPVGSRVGDFRAVLAVPGTGVFFDLRPDLYDVAVHWDTGARDTFFDVRVAEARTTTLDVRF